MSLACHLRRLESPWLGLKSWFAEQISYHPAFQEINQYSVWRRSLCSLSLGKSFTNHKDVYLFCSNFLPGQAGPKWESLEPGLDAGWGVSGQWVEEQLAQGDPRMGWKSKARKKVERLNLKRQGQRARTHPFIQEQGIWLGGEWVLA